MTTYAGIDYSRGMSNVNHETGIHFGVISQNEVLQAWVDSSEPVYNCENCQCDEAFQNDECDYCEPCAYTYDQDGYKCEQLSEDTDIFITESPYYTYAQYCSPCAPGACYLMDYFKTNSLILNNKISSIDAYKRAAEKAGFPKVYCLDFSWFDDEKAPYPVFDVKTGELIKAN
jgi:hypothetical protein